MLTGIDGRTTRTADKLHSVESVDAARLQHGEAAEKHSTVDARRRRRVVPRTIRRAQFLIMDVVKHAVIWHEQRVALERTDCTESNTPLWSLVAAVLT